MNRNGSPNEILFIKHFLNLIVDFCDFISIINLSLCCKSINKLLDPETNQVINEIFLIEIMKEFFTLDGDNDNKNELKKNLIGKNYKFKTNFKKIYINFKVNFLLYENKAISQKILDFFRAKLFLQDLRKEIFVLEFENSSLHMLKCYDSKVNDVHTYNYLVKTLSPQYIFGNNDDNYQIKILRENLAFEPELINFKNIFKDFINNKQYCDFIINLRNLNYEYIDKIYVDLNIEKKGINIPNSGINKILLFILWITHMIIILVDFNYNYVKELSEYIIDDQEFLDTYLEKKGDLINISLLINSTYDNINIIVNFLGIYQNMNNYILTKSLTSSNCSTDSDSFNSNNAIISKDYINKNIIFSEKFSLYKYCHKIIEKRFTKELESLKVKRFKNLTINLFQELFNPQENIELNNSNKMDIEEEDNNSINEIKEDDECDDDFECSIEDMKLTKKETFENYCNSEVDDSINENNSKAIMNTELKISDDYKNNCENIIINSFIDEIIKNINDKKPLYKIYEVVSKLTHVDGNSKNLNLDQDSLILIRRTKYVLMIKSYKIIFNELLIIIYKDFVNRIKYDEEKEKKIIYINIMEALKLDDYNCNMDALTEDGGKNVYKEYEKEKENLANYLIKKSGLNASDNYLIYKYINNKKIPYVYFFKKVVLNYYKQLEIYKERDEKIINLLTNKNAFNEMKNCFEKKMINEDLCLNSNNNEIKI